MDPIQQPMEQQPQNNQQMELFSLEEMSVKNTSSIDDKRAKIKQLNEMIKETYAAHEEFRKQEYTVNGEKEVLKSIKQQVDVSPEVAGYRQQIKDIRGEIKENQETVTNCALEYLTRGGNPTIEKNGVRYNIVRSAKLVKAKAGRKRK